MGKRKVHITGSSNDSVTIGGLEPGDRDKIEAVIKGLAWMGTEDGNLVFHQAKNDLPSPVDDEEMLPFWRKFNPRQANLQLKLLDEERWPPFSPRIYIAHLCGYNYTPEFYIEQAKILEGFGFECMRSRRGEDGCYWEVWYLMGLWAAKGELKSFLAAIPKIKGQSYAAREKDELYEAVKYLCKNVSFGTLDVCAQRAAMVMD